MCFFAVLLQKTTWNCHHFPILTRTFSLPYFIHNFKIVRDRSYSMSRMIVQEHYAQLYRRQLHMNSQAPLSIKVIFHGHNLNICELLLPSLCFDRSECS